MTDTGPTLDAARIIDLDARRKARAEARKGDDYTPITLVIGGITFPLPEEMPADFAELVSDGRFRDGFEVLLGDAFDAFWDAARLDPRFRHGLSVEDLKDFADAIAPAYGLGGDSGNSSASSRSSRRTGRR